jgi:hypothetical protein
MKKTKIMSKNLSIFLIFVLLTLVMTYPLILNINTCIPGFFSTDESYAALWDSWRIKYSFLNALSFKNTSLIVHPFGIDLFASGYVSYLWMGLFYFLSLIATPVLTYNFQVFFNFLLNAMFTFLLVFYLTKNRLSAVFTLSVCACLAASGLEL